MFIFDSCQNETFHFIHTFPFYCCFPLHRNIFDIRSLFYFFFYFNEINERRKKKSLSIYETVNLNVFSHFLSFKLLFTAFYVSI